MGNVSILYNSGYKLANLCKINGANYFNIYLSLILIHTGVIIRGSIAFPPELPLFVGQTEPVGRQRYACPFEATPDTD